MYIYDKLGGEGGMTMLKEMTFTDARYNLTEVIDFNQLLFDHVKNPKMVIL